MPESPDELVLAARNAAFEPDPTLAARLATAMQTATAPLDLGKLYIARAIMLQGNGDTTECAIAARSAIPQFVAAGDRGYAAFASSMAANFVGQNGDLAASIDHAADAMEYLSDADPNDIQTLRASIGVAGFLMRASAFDLTIEIVERAFRRAREGTVALSGIALDTLAYNVGYIAAEGGHVATDSATREQRLAPAVDAATWLSEHGSSDITRHLMGTGLLAEVAHARGQLVDSAELEAHAGLYDTAPDDLIAWHRLVRGSAVRRDGRADDAINLLDAAIPGLEASADNHCLVRALQERSVAHGDVGDWEGAYRDAVRRGDLVRGWQIDGAQLLAEQVSRRVEAQRDRAELQSTADQLLHDIDHDALTGTRSRHWLENHLDLIEQTATGVAIVMIDIDHFKEVNDVYGHSIGDETLARFGSVVQTAVGPDHPIARFGGEEFVVLVDGAIGDGESIAEKIRSNIAAHDWDTIAPGLDLTTSAGVSSGSTTSARRLMISADQALLEAKRRGRDRIVVAPTLAVI